MILQDIPKLYTAASEWMICLIFITILPLRYSRVKTAATQGVVLIVLGILQYYIGIGQVKYWLAGMALAVGVMFLSVFSCAKLTVKEAALCTASAFMLAEFIAALEWQLYTMLYLFLFYKNQRNAVGQAAFCILFAVAFYGVSYRLCRRWIIRLYKDIRKMDITRKEAISAIVKAVVIFLASNVEFALGNVDYSTNSVLTYFGVRTVMDYCGVLSLFLRQERWNDKIHQREMLALDSILQRHYEQYHMYRENMEELNRRYHDLKHQITAIRMETDDEKKEQYLRDLEEGLDRFSVQDKTGNPVLDVILREKHLYCVQHGINYTCVADGTLLNHMDIRDVCAVFGNALDNAVECELQISEKEKRLIRVAVFSENRFVIIRFENYCDKEIVMEDGMPISSKHEKELHGYGLKSIRAIAEKYDGTITIHAEDNWFQLRMMIPKI